MDKTISFFNFSVAKITPKEVSADSKHIQMLYYGLLMAIYVLTVLQVNIYYQQLTMLAVTNAVMLGGAIILLKWLTYKANWKAIAHSLLIAGTLLNLTDVLVVLQKIDNVTIGVIIMVILFSFYALDQRAGILYSLLNIAPITIFAVLQSYQVYNIGIVPEHPPASTLIISLIGCFGLVVFVFSRFYRAYLYNNNLLKETYEQQKVLNQKYKLAIEKAERSFEAKSEFLSTMSHEIRTPLNAVIGMSNLLIMDDPRPEQKENLEVLKFSAGNLLSIVNDMLDFNKIESGKLVFENVKLNLGELMKNICAGQAILAQEKGLSFILEVDEVLSKKEIFGEPTRITQILFNLVSNAIKFTHKGNIQVKVTCIEQKTSLLTVKFTVKDTGIGIKPDKLKLIFEPFTQESLSTTRQYGGTGLGLAIVKRLLESQGLQIQVDSESGEGSEFSFTMEFPVAAETQTALAETPVAKMQALTALREKNLHSLKVLIAEDNPVNVMLMKKLLSKWKIVPTIAENGERAVELMHCSEFDIVLMDLQMPLMNGFDAAVEIRKMSDPKKANVPIIALTASALFDIKQKVYASGMNEYISKPFKPSELLEKMQILTAVIA